MMNNHGWTRDESIEEIAAAYPEVDVKLLTEGDVE
jgi:uncharacterized protein (DUF433 family)